MIEKSDCVMSESLLLGKLLTVWYCIRLVDKIIIILFDSAKSVDKFSLHQILNLVITCALENTKVYDNHKCQSC